MAPRSIWKGHLGFGIVQVPVKLYSATEEKGVHFNQLHRECGQRIQMPKWCPTCARKVEAEELVKGYEVSKGQYMVMEEADFQALPLKSLKTIEVVEFVPGSGIDPRHYDKAYFLAPDEAGGKAFMLFLQVVEEMGLTAVAKLCYRDRDHLSALRPFGGVMLLQTLFYTDELRDPVELYPKTVPAVSDKEKEMARRLVEAMKAPAVDLTKFRDEYRDALTKVIEAKLAGQPIQVAPEAPAKVVDLADALLASIQAAETAKVSVKA